VSSFNSRRRGKRISARFSDKIAGVSLSNDLAISSAENPKVSRIFQIPLKLIHKFNIPAEASERGGAFISFFSKSTSSSSSLRSESLNNLTLKSKKVQCTLMLWQYQEVRMHFHLQRTRFKKKKKKFEQKSIPISGSSRTLKLPNKNCLIIGLTVSRTSSRYEKTNLSRKQKVKTK
jgi:hypothetical protein